MILLSINREEYFITRMDVNLYRTGMNLSYLRNDEETASHEQRIDDLSYP